jgi:hypothetical protein
MQVTILESASEADVRDLTARVAAFEEIAAENRRSKRGYVEVLRRHMKRKELLDGKHVAERPHVIERCSPFLGNGANRFIAEVRPDLIEIPMGK